MDGNSKCPTGERHYYLIDKFSRDPTFLLYTISSFSIDAGVVWSLEMYLGDLASAAMDSTSISRNGVGVGDISP